MVETSETTGRAVWRIQMFSIQSIVPAVDLPPTHTHATSEKQKKTKTVELTHTRARKRSQTKNFFLCVCEARVYNEHLSHYKFCRHKMCVAYRAVF